MGSQEFLVFERMPSTGNAETSLAKPADPQRFLFEVVVVGSRGQCVWPGWQENIFRRLKTFARDRKIFPVYYK